MDTHVIAKTAVFREDGMVLVLTRSDNDAHRPGGYDLPGGRADKGEDVADAACREAMEETGLKLGRHEVTLLYAACQTSTNDEIKETANFVWLGFVASLPAGAKITLSHEHKGFEWMPVDDAIKRSGPVSHTGFLEHLRSNNLLEGSTG